MPKMKFWNGTTWIPLDAQDADTVDGKHASEFAPANHIGSGGTAHALATTSAPGFLSKEDKAKLDGIAALAQPNQNAFSNVKVGTTTLVADGVTDTLELVAGSNITLTPDDVNDRIIISSAGSSATGEMNQNAFSAVKIGATQIDADNTMDILSLAAGTNITLSADTATDTVTIGTTAQPNQNAFSNVKIGSTILAADSPTDTVELIAGTNILLTPNESSDAVTIALTGKVGDADTLDGQHGSYYATATSVSTLTNDFNVHVADYSSYASGKDVDGLYTVVDYKRADGTLYMKSTLSSKNVAGYYGTDTWQFYNTAGSAVTKTVTWTLTYDAEGTLISKVVS